MNKQYFGIFENEEFKIIGTQYKNTFGEYKINEIVILKGDEKIYQSGNNLYLTIDTISDNIDKILIALKLNHIDIVDLLFYGENMRFQMAIKRIIHNYKETQEQIKRESILKENEEFKKEIASHEKNFTDRIIILDDKKALIIKEFKGIEKLDSKFLKDQYNDNQFNNELLKHIKYIIIDVSDKIKECKYLHECKNILYKELLNHLNIVKKYNGFYYKIIEGEINKIEMYKNEILIDTILFNTIDPVYKNIGEFIHDMIIKNKENYNMLYNYKCQGLL